MTDATSNLIDIGDVMQVLNDYARACDQRQWPDFEQIFSPDITVNYGGEFQLEGRDNVVAMIRSMLGGCGPTQHLLGNFDVNIDGDTATSRCYVRAAHAGVGQESDTFYEVWAEYRDKLQRTPDGWRIALREMHIQKEVGSRGILQPAQ